ncbi:hypothetical protein BOTBODRAFT_435775 [Botryobasidium botryosum FD-172 SS1]|uniref:Uncharacterized protein n=1 Tax=Botryobasidium botryosum (strain FD-172 SS1) TaxID=930990 RepID=A0A067MUS1_BOTB1|nr:hypothetical protein BOTBODRAFT_435775 [Botryobasidium botryosum FD-172 SS1]
MASCNHHCTPRLVMQTQGVHLHPLLLSTVNLPPRYAFQGAYMLVYNCQSSRGHQSAASKPGPRCPTQSQIPIFSPDLGFFPPHLTASSASLPNQARREGVISTRQSSIACCPGALHH